MGTFWAIVGLLIFIFFIVNIFGGSREPTKIESYYQTNEVTGSFKFHSKVVGVTYESKTGKDRQKIAKRLRKGDILYLIPDRHNKHDANAIMVLTRNEDDVGFIPSHQAATMQHQLQNGDKFFAQVNEITGGGLFKSRGINISIFKVEI